MGTTELEHREARVNGVRLHYVVADGRGGPGAAGAEGRRDGAGAGGGDGGASRGPDADVAGEPPGPAASRPPIVLLHGFPEFWYSWRRQMRTLASEGWRVVAPDQRGYNLSDKPEGVDAYRIDELAADVAGLVRHLGARRAVVAGHDWGGAVAWHLARTRPELVERLAVLNAPHPKSYRRELRSIDQLLRSWYVFFFQLPLLPEAAIRAFDYAVLERLLRRDPARRDAFGPDEIAAYKAALDRPGALTGALNWYRANFRRASGATRTGSATDAAGAGSPPAGPSEAAAAAGGPRPRDPVEAPTLVVWGMQDRFLSPRLLDGLDRWVSDLRVERLPDASHWVMADAPGRVSALLAGFLAEAGRAR